MFKSTVSTVVLVLSLSSLSSAQSTVNNTTLTTDCEGTQIPAHYLLLTPGGNDPAPMVVFFRGNEGNGSGCPQCAPNNNSSLMTEAQTRGWYALSVLGDPGPATTTGSEVQNCATEAAIEHVLQDTQYNVDRGRIYAIGFSRGANDCLAYAARHLDQHGAGGSFAAVIVGGSTNLSWSDRWLARDGLGCGNQNQRNGIQSAVFGLPTCDDGPDPFCTCNNASTPSLELCCHSPQNNPLPYARSSAFFVEDCVAQDLVICDDVTLAATYTADPKKSLVGNLRHIYVRGINHTDDSASPYKMHWTSIDQFMSGTADWFLFCNPDTYSCPPTTNGNTKHCWLMFSDPDVAPSGLVTDNFDGIELSLPNSGSVVVVEDDFDAHQFDDIDRQQILHCPDQTPPGQPSSRIDGVGYFEFEFFAGANKVQLAEMTNLASLELRTGETDLDPTDGLIVNLVQQSPPVRKLDFTLDVEFDSVPVVIRKFDNDPWEFMTQGVDWTYTQVGGTITSVTLHQKRRNNKSVATWSLAPGP